MFPFVFGCLQGLYTSAVLHLCSGFINHQIFMSLSLEIWCDQLCCIFLTETGRNNCTLRWSLVCCFGYFSSLCFQLWRLEAIPFLNWWSYFPGCLMQHVSKVYTWNIFTEVVPDICKKISFFKTKALPYWFYYITLCRGGKDITWLIHKPLFQLSRDSSLHCH